MDELNPDLEPLLKANRANWNARVPIHLGPEGYATERYVDDLDRISDTVALDRPKLGDLRGKRVVHLQCHIGTDTISLARLGPVEVVGVDFSEPALAAARNLVAATGDNVRFVLADVYQAAERVAEHFDLVYTSVGTICWLNDIERWANNVAGLLRPGGRFVFRDLHPTMWTYEEVDGQIVPYYSYWQAPEDPLRFDETESYLGTGVIESPRTYEWNHTIAEVVNALIDAGLRIDRLDEHRGCDWQLFPSAVPRGSQFVLPDGLRDKLPVGWSISATRN